MNAAIIIVFSKYNQEQVVSFKKYNIYFDIYTIGRNNFIIHNFEISDHRLVLTEPI